MRSRISRSGQEDHSTLAIAHVHTHTHTHELYRKTNKNAQIDQPTPNFFVFLCIIGLVGRSIQAPNMQNIERKCTGRERRETVDWVRRQKGMHPSTAVKTPENSTVWLRTHQTATNRMIVDILSFIHFTKWWGFRDLMRFGYDVMIF